MHKRNDDLFKKDTTILDEMLDNSNVTLKEPNWFASIIGFFTASIMGGVLVAALFLPVVIPVAAAPDVAQTYWDSLPTELPEISLPQHSYIYSSDGKEIATFYSENRIEIPLEEMGTNAINALIATEDSRFYEHSGVDWRGIARAVRNNAMHGENEGASTITQQLVKNTLVLSAKNTVDQKAATANSYGRKFDEISYALALEEKFSKDEILERYFNTVLFSNGVYGIGTAAEYYFNKPASDLSIAESALLVGLLKNPTKLNPAINPEGALNRRKVVLGRMLSVEVITQEEYDNANLEPIGVDITKTPNGCGNSEYPFYCQWVVDNLGTDSRLGDTDSERAARLYLGGLEITTALDLQKQNDLQKNVDKMFGRDNRVAIGVAMVEPGTGNVLAMAQNRDWGTGVDEKTGNQKTQIVLPATVAYQSGSSFKPFTLAAALESGFPYNASLNAPVVFKPADMNTPKNGIQNLSSANSGVLSINKATALSSNTWYAQLQYQVGVLTVADMAKNLGISVPDNVTSKDASFTLGTTDTSPLEMSAAFAAFAADGLYCPPRGVTQITSELGVLNDEVNKCRQAMSKGTANRVTEALVSTIDGEEENRTGKLASLGRSAGGKSGTTNAHSAAWFVGYTPDISTAVWIGDPRGGFKYPLKGGVRYNGKYVYDVYASSIAAPAWKRIMLDAHKGIDKHSFELKSASSHASTTVVPDVRGMTVETAVGTLQAQGFKVTISGDTVDAPEGFNTGQVVSQSPASGRKIFNVSNTTITLTVVKGTVIPDIIR